MGVVLTFYVPHHEAAKDPDEYGWDVEHYNRVRMACKLYELHSTIYNHADFSGETPYHRDREPASGVIPAGVLAGLMGDFYEGKTIHPDDIAARGYIAALPPDRPVVIFRD